MIQSGLRNEETFVSCAGLEDQTVVTMKSIISSEMRRTYSSISLGGMDYPQLQIKKMTRNQYQLVTSQKISF
jgi:hypothetical protein